MAQWKSEFVHHTVPPGRPGGRTLTGHQVRSHSTLATFLHFFSQQAHYGLTAAAFLRRAGILFIKHAGSLWRACILLNVKLAHCGLLTSLFD